MKNKFSLQRAWFSTLASRLVLGFFLLAVIGNIAFVVIPSNAAAGKQLLTTRQEQSQQVNQAIQLDGQRTLLATLNNQVIEMDHGQSIQSMQFSVPIAGLVASPDKQTFYIGTSDGKITVLNSTFQRLRQMSVTGRIVGMDQAGNGGIVVAHGVGTYSENYYVSYFSPEATAATTQVKTNFTITAFQAMQGYVAYGTANSQVGLLHVGERNVRWSVTLAQAITQVLLYSDTRMLVGDHEGDLALLDERGQTLWNNNLSSFPIQNLGYDPESHSFFAVDTQGQLFVVDQNGNTLTSQQIASDQLAAFIPQHGGDFLVVPHDGSWETLDPTAVKGLIIEQTLRPFWIGFNILAMGGLLISLILAVQGLRARARRIGRHIVRARLAYFFLLPAIVLTLIFNYYPAVLAVYYSFTSFSLSDVTQFVGLDNYRAILFDDSYFRVGIVNMVILLLTSILKTITFPLLAAELVFWLRNNVHRYIFRTLFVLPAVVPGLVFTLMWKMVYDPYAGLLNELLGKLGLLQWQHAWLGEEATALGSIIGIGFPWISAFTFLIFLSGLLNINQELYDAAKVDGAGWLRCFLTIDLAFLLPQFRVLIFFALSGTVQGFTDIFILTRGGPGTSTYVPALQMYFATANGRFGYASAIGILLFILILALTIFVLRFRRQTIEEAG